MIWPIIFVLLFIIFTWRSIYDTACEFIEYFMYTLLFILFSIFVFGMGIGVSLLVGIAIPKQWREVETVQLISLRDSEGLSGSFFLGSGKIGTTPYYFFYKKVGNGYQLGKVAVDDNVIVFEEKREDGQLKVYTRKFTNPSLRWIALTWPSHKHEFVIPEGSIKRNFLQ